MEGKPPINIWMILTLVLAGVIAGYGISQIPGIRGNISETAVVKNEEARRPPIAENDIGDEAKKPLNKDQIEKLPDDDEIFGDPAAPITVVEFSDFQCPFCKKFFEEAFPDIEKNYIKTGKVKFVYRDFPLDGHKQAVLAAQAAECAKEQKKFREMHDLLFETQGEWSGSPAALEFLKSLAVRTELKKEQFNACLDQQKYFNEIRKDYLDGFVMGVTGTPGFFINGEALSGAMPYEQVFKPIFEALLAGKKWKLEFDARGLVGVKTF